MTGTRKERSAGVRIVTLGLAVMVVSLIVLMTARPAEAAPNAFTVDRSDDPDLSTTPVADNCTAAIADDCSLRGAITKANRTANDAAGPDEIRFNIPGAGPHTVSPTSPLPNITGTVTMDGYTQPGASERTATTNAVLKIEISGASAGQLVNGLFLDTGAGDTTIRGLVINRFGAAGVFVNAQNTVIEGNYIGTNPAGDADLGNGVTGVRVRSSGNLIGGTSPGAKNVVSGNGDIGVGIDGLGATNNRIEGNRIGTNANGTSAIGNGQGVTITSASGNSVGGSELGAGNLISGNARRGVLLAGDAADNLVQSNFIGINIFGSADLGNGAEGVEIFEGSNNTIGGTASRTGNIISGNDADGVELNLAANDNRIQGNLIGTGQNGALDLGNGEVGVLVRGPDNTVGGTLSGARNVISGNGGVGVTMLGTVASGNAVQGNLIGTQVDGTTPLGNFHGVFISDASGNTIGGAFSTAANTISGNANDGVKVVGADAAGNRILRNSIFENGTPGGLGIELNNDGVSTNDPNDGDDGPNNLQNFPVISSAATSGLTKVRGTLDSTPNQNFTIQLFSNPAPNFPTGFGEGKSFMGETTVTTNTSGFASFTFTSQFAIPVGQLVTATATRNSTGDTSEFSAAVEIRAPIVVNSTGDTGDALLADSPSVCDADPGAPGLQCTLRAAIQEANTGFGDAETITFDIPGTGVRTISPASALPAITQPLTIDGYSQPGASQNTLATGTNADLRIQLNGANAGGSSNGLSIDASGSVVTGLAINRFARGIRLAGSNNRVEGNFIGVNAAGTSALGNAQQGVLLAGSDDGSVGGIDRRARNVISGNEGTGVTVGAGSTGNGIEGNLIGTSRDGTGDLGNALTGVLVSGASANTVGGAISGSANTVLFNGGDGVTVTEPPGSTATGNRILRNSIFSNDGLGIDLNNDGSTANDAGDGDAGPNSLQNKPVLTSATTTAIQGTLNSTPGRTFTIQFFRNPSGDEGRIFIGQRNVTTNANGNATFILRPEARVPAGQTITATATGAGNTSEFSAPRTVQAS